MILVSPVIRRVQFGAREFHQVAARQSQRLSTETVQNDGCLGASLLGRSPNADGYEAEGHDLQQHVQVGN